MITWEKYTNCIVSICCYYSSDKLLRGNWIENMDLDTINFWESNYLRVTTLLTLHHNFCNILIYSHFLIHILCKSFYNAEWGNLRHIAWQKDGPNHLQMLLDIMPWRVNFLLLLLFSSYTSQAEKLRNLDDRKDVMSRRFLI